VASIQTHTIQFIQNNPYGTFVAGDVLEVFIDDTLVTTPATNLTDAITVTLNGSPLGSGPLVTTDESIVAVDEGGVSFCNSTFLVTTGIVYTWPYGNYSTQADHPSCAVAPTVCDLIVVGAPIVVNATGDTNADGQITVTASSTNTIEYSLNPFGYGSGQSTGVFTGLLPGTYRVWLRDSLNCSANVLVTVGITYTYGDRFILEYDDLKGYQTKLLVTKKSYSGSLDIICGSGNPFNLSLRGEGSSNKFEPLLAGKGDLELTSETDLQFLEIYTNDPNLYRLEYYKDFGSGYVLHWTGKILPNQYSEDYKFPPYYVSIVCSDGLPELKDYYLMQDDGQRYFGTISLIKLVALLLKPLALDLDILVACNMYATGMDSTATDDPFDQAYVDYEAIYLKEAFPSYDFILRSILEPFGCRIIQWENRWNIIRVEELKADFDYRIFDSLGDYSSNSTYSPVHSIGTDVQFVNPNQGLEIRPGYGNIKVNYDLGLKPNILNNGDFRLNQGVIDLSGWTLVNAGYPLSEYYEKIDGSGNVAYSISADESILTNTEGGNAYLQSDSYSIKLGTNNSLKISFNVKVSRTTVTIFGISYTVEVPYVKIRAIVQYGSLYLMNDGNWTSTENVITFHLTEFDKYTKFELSAKQPTTGTPLTGMDFSVKVYHAYAYHAQFDSIANLKAFETYNLGETIPTGYKTELRDDFTQPSKIYHYELEETTDADSGYLLVTPDDYHVTNNPRKWRIKHSTNGISVGSISGANVFPFYIDVIRVEFLTGGEAPFDSIVRTAIGESGNKDLLDKDLIFGSSGDLITTEVYYDYGIPKSVFDIALKSVPSTIQIVTSNILSYQLIYTGYLRDSSGDGWETWTRDGVAESEKLHGIFLKQYAAQYKKSWRLLRASIRNKDSFFGLLNVLEETGDNNRLYLPISLTLDDKNCITSGEFLELVEGVAGSDGTPEAPFNSGFTTGFGASGFN
jgi:hypothetical protein